MIEFILVDHPTVLPMACVICGSAKGPIADTHVEKWGDHLYLCRLCTTRAARLYGLVKGERMEQLLAADETLAGKQAEIKGLEQELTEARLEAGGQRATIKALNAQLQEVRGRQQVMTNLALELERISKEVVENAVGPQQVEAAVAA